MGDFYQRLIIRAATIDELLSNDFETLPGQKSNAELATRRLAAWCRSSASGDWSLFNRRLARDGLSIGEVLARFANVRRRTSATIPTWAADAIWIEAALCGPGVDAVATAAGAVANAYPFEHLFGPVVEHAEMRLLADLNGGIFDNLNEGARRCFRRALLKELCTLAAPALYERFGGVRKASAALTSAGVSSPGSVTLYDQFIADMRAGGCHRLFEDKPVLLRLIASLTRQWIDTTREFIARLAADAATIRREILSCEAGKVTEITGDLSDPHNRGRSVQILTFESGSRVVYKPKELRIDVAWHALVTRLNAADSPVVLRAPKALARDGYGWTEFIAHEECTGEQGIELFFRRAGAWLALFRCFAAADMHHENVIAACDHPVPIDLEMILQARAQNAASEPEMQALRAASDIVADSVMMVGLLPAYGRAPDQEVYAIGGMAGGWKSQTKRDWQNINSDAMRPARSEQTDDSVPNLPHTGGRYAKFGDHIGVFIEGFRDYATFLTRKENSHHGSFLDEFAGLPVRKIHRPTRFYYMLSGRLRDHRTMNDGITWSAQADFMARLADWDKDYDPTWPLQRAERSALVELYVPYFSSMSDGRDIRDANGFSIGIDVVPGLDRARARLQSLDERDIAWQIEVIQQNTGALARSNDPAAGAKASRILCPVMPTEPGRHLFLAEADRIAAELSNRAIRRASGAAWIGLDWLGDSEVWHLVALGPDLYNGLSGLGVFLAAHAAVTGNRSSGELALAAVSLVRKNLRSRNAARIARWLGVGGGTGLGSIVYALSLMAMWLRDDVMLADAKFAVGLFTDELIDADRQLDVIGGGAGAILSLLRLYRDTRSDEALACATRCGEHLLTQPRVGHLGFRTWRGLGAGAVALNGMSHGAAGYAYALASLSAATGRDDFASAAAECLAFENASYDEARNNWPDLRGGKPSWPCQWCHGASGIGLARIAGSRRRALGCELVAGDVRNALKGVERSWPGHVDTLCCGTLGSIEFFCEAGDALGRDDLRKLAAWRLMSVVESAKANGGYRWDTDGSPFNLGLFRGLAGVGYTCLRQIDPTLPNLLVWE
ncbi:MAG: type 2 lantipeptide synthetase LanM family protein [Hyphomicrobiales bacterium]|nr:type 2 lantipeptide synthetase LanM family protein [Hyphomicrobiales bacterium]MBV8826744.1 type 2 lantipeptide synthetase LanM family protein [Hyphomicrobiales bacterium]